MEDKLGALAGCPFLLTALIIKLQVVCKLLICLQILYFQVYLYCKDNDFN